MKSIIVGILLIIGSHEANAAWKCSYKHTLPLEILGATKDSAASKLVDACYEVKCEQMKGVLEDPLEKILNLTKDEFRDLLELSGGTYSEEEVTILYRDRKNYLPKKISQPNCHNSQLFQDLVKDTCSAIPQECLNF